MYKLTQIIIIFTLVKISETVRQRSTFSITWFKLSHNYCVKKHPAFFFLFHLLAFVAFTQPLFTQLPFYTTLKNYTTLFKKNYTTLFTQHFFTQPICSVSRPESIPSLNKTGTSSPWSLLDETNDIKGTRFKWQGQESKIVNSCIQTVIITCIYLENC